MPDKLKDIKFSEKPLDYRHLKVFLDRMSTSDGFDALLELATMDDVDTDGIEEFMRHWSCHRVEQTHEL